MPNSIVTSYKRFSMYIQQYQYVLIRSWKGSTFLKQSKIHCFSTVAYGNAIDADNEYIQYKYRQIYCLRSGRCSLKCNFW